ncbi:TerC family protein [Eggerthellaceae bacterium zg-887]|uniref:TerC family protein n=1 Tax=Xiamenia xianingshaonis TaxID=2682776 RepID=UPI00140E017B|nr:TerC family protein [Xiamenia xianingshaonis]NHM16964.1 TerC family protein [Xiamenia xianingshaonis]
MDLLDFSIFTTPEAWISLITLIFLEIVLGVDNLVFISITTNRLPADKQHIGRKLGLGGALVMRVIFLCFASYLVHLVDPLFTIDVGFYSHGFSVRDLVLLLGGLYLVYKGFAELRDMLALTEVKAEHSDEHKALHLITLPQAVGTIMVMDLVFSIDSVITAVGLAEHLIIMIIAVMLAVFLMMAFIDPISDFINSHPEMKILALTFIIAIGALLIIDAAGFHTGIELMHISLEKLMVYFAMIFSIVLEVIQMRYHSNLAKWKAELVSQQGGASAKAGEVGATASEEGAGAGKTKN